MLDSHNLLIFHSELQKIRKITLLQTSLFTQMQGMSIQYYWYFQYFQNGIGYWYFQYFWIFCQIKVLVLNIFILTWPIPNTFHSVIFFVYCVFLWKIFAFIIDIWTWRKKTLKNSYYYNWISFWLIQSNKDM